MTGPAIPDWTERRALPLDAMRARLDQMLGHIDLDALLSGQSPQAPDPLQRAAAHQAAQLFAGPEGQDLLEYLADATVRRPTVLPPLSCDPERAYAQMQRRAGQDDVFWFLLRLIAMGREQEPINREGAQL